MAAIAAYINLSYRLYLFVSSAGSGTVSVYEIDQETGALALLPAQYAASTSPSAMAVRPYGNFLYVASRSASRDISAFLVDAYYGGLRPVVGSPFSSGGNVGSLAFGAGETFLYAAHASGGTANISGFRIHSFSGDPNDGALTPLPGFPYDLRSCNDIAADQTGSYLYATAGMSVFGFSIDAQSGSLNPLPGSPFAIGDTAEVLSIDPSNRFLYVTSRSSGSVTGFSLNAATGELTLLPRSPATAGQSADFIATL